MSTDAMIEVRRAHATEVQAIGDLTADTYAGDGLVGGDYVPVLRDAASRYRDPHTLLFVAVEPGEAGDQLLGAIAYTRPGSAFSDVGGPGEAGFRMLVTAPQARGRGVGEALVRACLAQAAEDHLEQLVLFTGDNMTVAHRLYGRLGFTRAPWRDHQMAHGSWLRAYARRLAPVDVLIAGPEHFAAIGALTVAAYDADGLLDHATDDTGDYREVLRDAAGRSGTATLLVAVTTAATAAGTAGTVIGTVAYAPPGSGLGEVASAGEVEFRMLAVAPQAQGLGVGAALVHAVLDLARQDGADAVVLSTQDEAASAQHLYGRLGFERVPSRDWSPIPGLILRVFRRDL